MEHYHKRFGHRGWLVLILGAVLAGGCAGKRAKDEAAFARVFTPQAPEFLNGAAAVLLTNGPGFSAMVLAHAEPAFVAQGDLEGELLSRDGRLFFAPKGSERAKGKPGRPANAYFIWDVRSSSGYVLSEPLQGYAPVASNWQATNVIQGPSPGGVQEVTVQMNDGSSRLFQVTRDAGSKDVPVRISSIGVSPRLTLTLSRIRHEPPPKEMFSPPESFSKYPTPEALADELAARQHNVRRGFFRPPESSDLPRR